MNLHQHAKNKTVSSICSGEIVCLKNPKSDGLTESIWPISQEQDTGFFQIKDLCGNTANNKNFHFRTNSVKINDQIFLN